jgi:hypothetical protein
MTYAAALNDEDCKRFGQGKNTNLNRLVRKSYAKWDSK